MKNDKDNLETSESVSGTPADSRASDESSALRAAVHRRAMESERAERAEALYRAAAAEVERLRAAMDAAARIGESLWRGPVAPRSTMMARILRTALERTEDTASSQSPTEAAERAQDLQVVRKESGDLL